MLETLSRDIDTLPADAPMALDAALHSLTDVCGIRFMLDARLTQRERRRHVVFSKLQLSLESHLEDILIQAGLDWIMFKHAIFVSAPEEIRKLAKTSPWS